MQNSARNRLENELRIYNQHPLENDGVWIEVEEMDIMSLKGFIKGVEGTPYAGGTFELEIKIGESYPYKAPSIKFVTKIWHPSVNPFDGSICLADKKTEYWPVAMTIHKTLITIQSWLSDIKVKEPIDLSILDQATRKPDIFEKTAEFWAIRYAGAPKPLNPEYLEKSQVLTRLSKSENISILALSYNHWDLSNEVKTALRSDER